MITRDLVKTEKDFLDLCDILENGFRHNENI